MQTLRHSECLPQVPDARTPKDLPVLGLRFTMCERFVRQLRLERNCGRKILHCSMGDQSGLPRDVTLLHLERVQIPSAPDLTSVAPANHVVLLGPIRVCRPGRIADGEVPLLPAPVPIQGTGRGLNSGPLLLVFRPSPGRWNISTAISSRVCWRRKRFSYDALMNDENSGCGSSGFDLNSGWNWQPRKNG